MTGKLTAVFVLLLFGAAAEARGRQQQQQQQQSAQTAEDPCAPEAQRSPQLMACAERHLKEAEAELRDARRKLSADLSAQTRLKMRRAERAWLGYRKSNCEAEASIYEGGTIQPLMQTRCLARVTRARAEELRAQRKALVE